MNDQIANRTSAGLARRGVAALTILAALAAGILSAACGGGGGSTDQGGNGGGTPGTASGTLYWFSGFSGYTLNLAAGTKQPTKIADLSLDSRGQLGYGGGMFTNVEVTDVSPSYVTVNLRNVAPNPYTLRSKLGPFPLDGLVGGPIQPSPDGQLFAMFTQEDSVTYVYVFDAALNIVFKLPGYESRSWLGNDRIVVTKGSNLYTVTVTSSPIVTRIGPDGLGLPSEPVKQPSVSPDRTSIAYLQGSAVWRINVDGSGLTQLTKPYVGGVGWPSWSPDGSRLVVSSECTTFGGGLPSTNEMIVISATAANQDLATIDFVTPDCGPVYWLPS
jgi:WD40-like Beta Propeller Repeat